jgi:hypothetical protein
MVDMGSFRQLIVLRKCADGPSPDLGMLDR